MSRLNPRFHRNNPQLPAALPNVVQLTLFFTLENQICLNNLYYFDGGLTASITLLTSFLSAWVTAHQAALLGILSADTTFTQVKAFYTNVPAIIPQYQIIPAGTVGTGGSGHEPTPISVVFSKASNIKGQSGRGRFYSVGVPPAAVTGSTLTPSTAFQTNAALWVTHMNNNLVVGANSYLPGIFSRRGYNKVSGAGGGFSGLTTVYIRQILGTVRRRRLGRGK